VNADTKLRRFVGFAGVIQKRHLKPSSSGWMVGYTEAIPKRRSQGGAHHVYCRHSSVSPASMAEKEKPSPSKNFSHRPLGAVAVTRMPGTGRGGPFANSVLKPPSLQQLEQGAGRASEPREESVCCPAIAANAYDSLE
jgi:hypothetical protein